MQRKLTGSQLGGTPFFSLGYMCRGKHADNASIVMHLSGRRATGSVQSATRSETSPHIQGCLFNLVGQVCFEASATHRTQAHCLAVLVHRVSGMSRNQ